MYLNIFPLAVIDHGDLRVLRQISGKRTGHQDERKAADNAALAKQLWLEFRPLSPRWREFIGKQIHFKRVALELELGATFEEPTLKINLSP